jgi:CelD/BcsL family acetyltransferase involved in cellulose biosynthesis
MTALQITAVDPRTDRRWGQLAAGPLGSLFTSPPWIEAFCTTYGMVPEARVAVDPAGRTLGGFAWVPIDDMRGGRHSSLPFCDRADPFVTDEGIWKEVSADVFSAGQPLTLRCFDTAVAASDARFDQVGAAAWHGTPLAGSAEELHARLSGTARRNIRTAHRSGVRIEADTSLDGVLAFHRLHVGLRKRKYRLLAQPVAFFEAIWRAFSAADAVVTLLARCDDTVVAGAVFLVWNDTLYYKFGASSPEHLAVRPNDAIFWAGINWGLQRNLSMLDWGLSDLDQPGLVAYKRKWATTERRIVTLRPAGSVSPGHREIDGILGELTRLLTADDVPDHITERAGELLYRYFS